MPLHCCVPLCKQRGVKDNNGNKVSFFAFPKEPTVRKKWVIAIKRDEGKLFTITKYTKERVAPSVFGFNAAKKPPRRAPLQRVQATSKLTAADEDATDHAITDMDNVASNVTTSAINSNAGTELLTTDPPPGYATVQFVDTTVNEDEISCPVALRDCTIGDNTNDAITAAGAEDDTCNSAVNINNPTNDAGTEVLTTDLPPGYATVQFVDATVNEISCPVALRDCTIDDNTNDTITAARAEDDTCNSAVNINNLTNDAGTEVLTTDLPPGYATVQFVDATVNEISCPVALRDCTIDDNTNDAITAVRAEDDACDSAVNIDSPTNDAGTEVVTTDPPPGYATLQFVDTTQLRQLEEKTSFQAEIIKSLQVQLTKIECALLEAQTKLQLALTKYSVMADKGFRIEDQLKEINVELNTPPFLRKGNFTTEEVKETEEIASLRIHVERRIQRIKGFHIFDRPVSISLAPVVNEMWFICAVLTNLQSPLMRTSDD
ncbi:THAP domain-containing protein 5-like [Ixodes scapularis]